MIRWLNKKLGYEWPVTVEHTQSTTLRKPPEEPRNPAQEDHELMMAYIGKYIDYTKIHEVKQICPKLYGFILSSYTDFDGMLLSFGFRQYTNKLTTQCYLTDYSTFKCNHHVIDPCWLFTQVATDEEKLIKALTEINKKLQCKTKELMEKENNVIVGRNIVKSVVKEGN